MIGLYCAIFSWHLWTLQTIWVKISLWKRLLRPPFHIMLSIFMYHCLFCPVTQVPTYIPTAHHHKRFTFYFMSCVPFLVWYVSAFPSTLTDSSDGSRVVGLRVIVLPSLLRPLLPRLPLLLPPLSLSFSLPPSPLPLSSSPSRLCPFLSPPPSGPPSSFYFSPFSPRSTLSSPLSLSLFPARPSPLLSSFLSLLPSSPPSPRLPRPSVPPSLLL